MQILKAFLIFLTVASPVFTFKVEVISIQVYSRRFREYTQLKRRNPGMIHMKKLCFKLKQYGTDLVRLGIASWLLTNTMFLLGSHVPFITLDFVRQISLESFLGIWFGICLCLAIPWFLSAHSGRIRLSLAPSMAMYIAALMLKETFI